MHPIYGEDDASKASGFFESGLDFLGNFAGQALNIAAQGQLNDMRDDAGLARPQSENQRQTLVGPGGENRTVEEADETDIKQWLIIGGGILLVIIVLMVLLGGRK
ncbi:hypothetical protein [Aliamphritea ceti]|uniref:hypothetical protein n=1 Tax=Aliamphritea ceti TaxID=1524258 RepID=UPI0021C4B685|nr:hypothetical protein [Aliamphritea ceti]